MIKLSDKLTMAYTTNKSNTHIRVYFKLWHLINQLTSSWLNFLAIFMCVILPMKLKIFNLIKITTNKLMIVPTKIK